jgi:hypothetical protein
MNRRLAKEGQVLEILIMSKFHRPFLCLFQIILLLLFLAPPLFGQEEATPKNSEKGEQRQVDPSIKALKKELDRLKKRVNELEKDPKKGEDLEPKKAPLKKEKKYRDSYQEETAPDSAPGESDSLNSIILNSAKRLKISGQIRSRGEIKNNVRDFDSGRSDEEEFALLRVRLGFRFEILDKLFATVELQDSRQYGSTVTPGNSTARERESIDLSLGFIEVHDVLIPGLNLRLGRQILSFGDERLVGAFEYNNFANRFDALSVIYRLTDLEDEGEIPVDTGGDKLRVHGFVSVLDETNTNSDDATFAGVYATVDDWITAGLVDAYYFLLNDTDERAFTGENGRTGNLRLHTAGSRIKLWLEPFILVLEGAYQAGSFADDDIQAFAASGTLIYKAFTLPWTPHFLISYNYASGDDDPTDNDRQTFRNLFPTNHLFYGVNDLFSWQNLENLQFRAKFFPNPDFTFFVDYHYFRLAEANDFHFNAGGVPIRADLSPRNSGRRASQTVGQELDVTFVYNINRSLSVFAQYGHFFAGPYYRSTSSDSDADFGQLSLTLNF